MGMSVGQSIWVFLLIWLMLFMSAVIFVPGFAFAEEPKLIVTAWVWTKDSIPLGWDECPPGYEYEKFRMVCESISFSWHKIPIYYIQADQIVEYCRSKASSGCYQPVGEIIYIIDGRAGMLPAEGGCNLLWHELGHAMGKTHQWMMKNWPAQNCHRP